MKKFIPVFCLLLIALGFCVAGDAITVPPWWMIGQSATTQGTASFTVPITTTGNISAATASTTGNATVGGTLGVTGKTTTGTLESGAATFTGNIELSPTVSCMTGNRSTTSASMNVMGRRYSTLGANMKYESGFKKMVDASASAHLEVDAAYGVNGARIWYSDAGSSDPFQYGPYTVWHRGMSTFNSLGTANSVYGPGTSDGSDSAYSSFCGGAYSSITRGGYGQFYGNEATGGYAGSVFLQAGDVASGNVYIRTHDISRLVITYGGDVRCFGFAGGGTTGASLDNDGDIIRTPSDIRLKEDIIDITAGLDKVRALRGVTFNWKDKASYGSRRDYGMIAQEVEAVIPEVVSQNPDGMKSLDYQKIVPVLVEAIKDQQRIIESLTSRVEALEAK